MTESDWLGCPSTRRLLGLLPLPLDARRGRLLACGICRQFDRFPEDDPLQDALDAAEAFADGQLSAKQRNTVQRRAFQFSTPLLQRSMDLMTQFQQTHDQATRTDLAERAALAARQATAARLIAACAADDFDAVFTGVNGAGAEGAMLSRSSEMLIEGHPEIVRDVVGNPFRRPAIDPLWLMWRDGFIAGLAASIYEDQRFDEMPILGDALEDAGCSDRTLLAHCHDDAPHVRGCWVLDRLLGRVPPTQVCHTEALLSAWPEKYSTPLDPVIATGVAQGGAVWISLRVESAILTEAVRLDSEVGPTEMGPATLAAIQSGLREALSRFAPRGRPLGGTCVTLLRVVFDPATHPMDLIQSAARDALERALHEAVMVPLETRSRGMVVEQSP
jgi:hypothetical protein